MPSSPHAPERPAIEIIRPDIQRGQIRHALFDFDGTLSLIREGWQGIMIPMMIEVLMQTPGREPQPALEAHVRELVARTTGIQTIYQMIQLQEEVRARGGEPLEALEYKRRYLGRLWEHIADRLARLKSGATAPEEMMVPGSRDILEALRARGVACYLASGTDVQYVRDEAEALGLAPYFEGRIYGALDDYRSYSKAMVIEGILREHHLEGPELVTFGDGYVEIENTVAVGGIAVGVATDEVRRRGVDEWKRQRLIAAGAHVIIPDFTVCDALVSYLFPPKAWDSVR